MISHYCEECVKFVQKECAGKSVGVGSTNTFYGTPIKQQHLSGLAFCNRYEFAGRFYTFPKGGYEQLETISHAIKRGKQKQVEETNQEIANDFDAGKKLSSADFADLLI